MHSKQRAELEVDDFEHMLHSFYTHEKDNTEIPLEDILSQVLPMNKAIAQAPKSEPETRAGWIQRWVRWWGAGSAGLVAAACLFFILPTFWDKPLPMKRTHPVKKSLDAGQKPVKPPEKDPSEQIDPLQARGVKGLHFSVFINRNSKPVEVVSGTEVFSGEQLRIVLKWNKGGQVFLVHRNAKNQWNPLYPDSASDKSFSLLPEKLFGLPGSITVTGPPEGNEEILGCFSKDALTFSQVQAILKKARPTAKTLRQSKGPCSYQLRFILRRPKGSK